MVVRWLISKSTLSRRAEYVSLGVTGDRMDRHQTHGGVI